MLGSTVRQLSLSGWLQEKGKEEYNMALKLQKFLFFYESFSKVKSNDADFSHLRGYKRGPVFSNVWGDYTHERTLFDSEANKAYNAPSISIDEEQAIKCHFLVKILSEKELSQLTHKMNIWRISEDRIMRGEHHVTLFENDFDSNDVELIKLLDEMYPIELIRNSHVVNIDNHHFIFSKNDISKLTEQHYDTLSFLSDNNELQNPIYVEIDKEGRLIVD